MVGSGGFKREVPNCNKMGQVKRRWRCLAKAMECLVSFFSSQHCDDSKGQLFLCVCMFFFFQTVPDWPCDQENHETSLIWALSLHLQRGDRSDELQGLFQLSDFVCAHQARGEGSWTLSESYGGCHPGYKKMSSKEMKTPTFFLAEVLLE